jgi:hypothetical protein
MLGNPELWRSGRVQLGPAKMVIAVTIIGVLSLAVGFSMAHLPMVAAGSLGWATQLLSTLFTLQALALAAGGGIACVNAIYKEKDQNTFDYQRVTRLTPLELTLGKLFGAPLFMYFVCLCCTPLVIFAAVRSEANFTFVLAAYAVLIVGSVLVHALALLVSLVAVRGAHTASILLILLVLWFFSVIPMAAWQSLRLGSLLPFSSSTLVTQKQWNPRPTLFEQYRASDGGFPGVTDVFFGHTIPHFPVLLVIDGLLIAWLLLALVRNIKRDPVQYELYSGFQTFGLVIFINCVLLAFVNWRSGLFDAQSALLAANIVLLGSLGLAQLRNRDRARRILRGRKAAGVSWNDLTWPAPLMFITSMTASLLILVAASLSNDPHKEWSPTFAIFRFLFVTVWLMRDMQFLQWMTLRRGKRPLVMGVLYLTAFYAAVWIVTSAFRVFADADRLPFTAFFLPTPMYYLDHAAWTLRPAIWAAAFITQWLLVAFFICAQRNTLLQLAHPCVQEYVRGAATAEN